MKIMYSFSDCYGVPKDSDLRKFGIYCIESKVSGKQYVGSTLNSFRERFQCHIKKLRADKHHSVVFQRSYNKNGVDSFKLTILEFIEDKDVKLLEQREQYWIDTLEPAFNIRKKAYCFQPQKNSEEYREGWIKNVRNRVSKQDRGVKRYRKTGLWCITMSVTDFIITNLGRFKTKEEASAVQKEMESLFWNDEFAALTIEQKRDAVKEYREKFPTTNGISSGHRGIGYKKSRKKSYRVYYKTPEGGRSESCFLTLEEALDYKAKFVINGTHIKC